MVNTHGNKSYSGDNSIEKEKEDNMKIVNEE